MSTPIATLRREPHLVHPLNYTAEAAIDCDGHSATATWHRHKDTGKIVPGLFSRGGLPFAVERAMHARVDSYLKDHLAELEELIPRH